MLIAHLSDLHIRPQGQLYQGLVDSNAMCEAAIVHLNALNPAPDVVIVTGDIVDRGSPAEYIMAKKLLSELKQPVLIIPGNHDDRREFRAARLTEPYGVDLEPFNFVACEFGPVRIIGLDITVPGKHHGNFDARSKEWLENALAQEPNRPTLIMMHHHPFLSGIPYIDIYGCENGESLANVIRRFPAVERVVCGHIHRSMQLRFGGSVLCTAPSTTTAIALQLDPHALEASFIEPPAMLLHHWKPDTGIITHWVPIGSFAGPMPFA